MKIRLLIDAKMLGGIETHVMSLYEELALRHNDCKIIFVCDYPNNILHTLCNKRSINYHACRTYRELYTLLSEEQPDIIHTHGYKANILGRLIGLIIKIPVISTFHSGETPIGRLVLYDFIDRWSSYISHNICVNSSISANLPSRSTVIPNFVSIPKSPNTLKIKGPYNIYFIGRFSPEKGPLRFCELATQAHPDLNWHMVGTGPLLDTCQENHANIIHFHGQISDMDSIWPDVDLLCITSTYEGLPLVLLEAMSRGIPVVSFDIGSIKEIQTDVEYIIEPYDLLKMTQCISTHFLKSLEERTIMANNARSKIISTYSREGVVSKIEAYYNECIK